MFNQSDLNRNAFMLDGTFGEEGYDWWWHSFTGISEKTKKERAFFVEFFTVNPGLGEKKPVLGQDPENKATGKRPSYLMVKAGSWGENPVQLHRFFGWKHVELKADAPFSIGADDCFASDTQLRGRIEINPDDAQAHPEWMCDGGIMKWDLKLDKKVAFNVGYGAGDYFRKKKAFDMYWHAEGIKTEYEGIVYFNGEKYIVSPENCYGYADKNWGRDFTSPWLWLSSNNLTSNITNEKLKGSVFDIGGGRPVVFGKALDRKFLGAFLYEGTEYEYNFSKFWTNVKTDFKFEETADKALWYVKQENSNSIMITEIECDKKDMIFVNYEAPDGSKRHNRLWNGGNGKGRIRLYKKSAKGKELIDDILAENVGCEYGEYDK